MLTVLLLVAAAVLLATGYANDQPGLVWVALVLSLLAALTVLAPRLLATVLARRSTRSGPDRAAEAGAVEPVPETVAETVAEPADEPVAEVVEAPAPATQPDAEVVFVPGRLTFHVPTCTAVAGKDTSAATRSQLEAGGMTACRRCLGVAGTR